MLDKSKWKKFYKNFPGEIVRPPELNSQVFSFLAHCVLVKIVKNQFWVGWTILFFHRKFKGDPKY